MLDPLGRKYIQRPIFFNTLLSRILSDADQLLGIFKELKSLQEIRYRVPGNFGSNIKSRCNYIRQAFSLLKDITIDAETVLYRETKEIPERYAPLIERIKSDIKNLETKEKKDEKEISRLKEKVDELEKEKLKKEIEQIEGQITQEEEILNSVEADFHNLIHLIRHGVENADVMARYHERDSTNPTAAVSEFSLRGNRLLLRKSKWKTIEVRSIHDKISGLTKEFKSSAKCFKSEKQVSELEAKLVKDTELVIHNDSILVHRILHSFLHRISLEIGHQEKVDASVIAEYHGTRAFVQETLKDMRNQIKKLKNEA